MRIAIASGKGGAGKTTVAVSLALTARGPVQLLDCDVEEPNAHLFTAPRIVGSRAVMVPVPVVDPACCDGCGECSAACAFNALACMGGPPLMFPELCHGCGGCTLTCPQQAISERAREVGVVEWGELPCGASFGQGRLNLGEAKAPPVIEAVLSLTSPAATTIVDCPPGTACPFVAAVRGADVALLVTEPTPFGLSDLTLAVEAVRQLGIPFGVAVNRAGSGDDRVQHFCRSEGIAVLAEIPDDRRIATAYSHGIPAVLEAVWLRPLFEGLHRDLAAIGHPNEATPARPPADARHGVAEVST